MFPVLPNIMYSALARENGRSHMCTQWTWTSFKPEAPPTEPYHQRALVYQQEQCPTTGRLHWQGYMELYRPHSIFVVQSLLQDDCAHCEPARSARHAIAYCKKDETAVADTRYSFETPTDMTHMQKLKWLATTLRVKYHQAILHPLFDTTYTSAHQEKVYNTFLRQIAHQPPPPQLLHLTIKDCDAVQETFYMALETPPPPTPPSD